MSGAGAEDVLDLLRSRRVCRAFSAEPLCDADLLHLLEAARWATNAGNTRVQRFLVVREPERIRLARALAPGMLAVPPAFVAICTDLQVAARAGVRVDLDPSCYVDVGTAAMAMMVEAHALGLGTCPVTSFSQAGVARVLELPASARPEFLLLVGHPARGAGRAGAGRMGGRRWSPRLRELVFWERYGDPLPERLLEV